MAAGSVARADLFLFIAAFYDKPPLTADKNRQAIRWYRLAAEEGNSFAATSLGVVYLYGTRVPRDVPLAVRWLRSAANAGDDHAQNVLGVLYCIGHGVTADPARAKLWWQASVAHGNKDARLHLANSHCRPFGSHFDPAGPTM